MQNLSCPWKKYNDLFYPNLITKIQHFTPTPPTSSKQSGNTIVPEPSFGFFRLNLQNSNIISEFPVSLLVFWDQLTGPNLAFHLGRSIHTQGNLGVTMRVAMWILTSEGGN